MAITVIERWRIRGAGRWLAPPLLALFAAAAVAHESGVSVAEVVIAEGVAHVQLVIASADAALLATGPADLPGLLTLTSAGQALSVTGIEVERGDDSVTVSGHAALPAVATGLAVEAALLESLPRGHRLLLTISAGEERLGSLLDRRHRSLSWPATTTAAAGAGATHRHGGTVHRHGGQGS